MRTIKKKLFELGLINIAFGLTVGHSAGNLLTSIVESLLMPVVAYAVGEDEWQTAKLDFGTISLEWGQVLSNTVHFVVLVLLVFFVLKLIEDKE